MPSDLSVDEFFDKSILVRLDPTNRAFKVYIPHQSLGMYMTISVRDRKVEDIFWAPYSG